MGSGVTGACVVVLQCDVFVVPILVGYNLGLLRGMGRVVAEMVVSIYFEGPGVTGLLGVEYLDDGE